MRPFVLSQIPPDELEAFEIIRKDVLALPDLDLGYKENGEKVVLSCHILSYAVKRTHGGMGGGLTYEEGRFLDGFDHSWLVTRNSHIIDVYPVGIVGGPIMVDGQAPLLSRRMYHPMKVSDSDRLERYDAMFQSLWFPAAVAKTSTALFKTHYGIPIETILATK
jgi:hypothetical protein